MNILRNLDQAKAGHVGSRLKALGFGPGMTEWLQTQRLEDSVDASSNQAVSWLSIGYNPKRNLWLAPHSYGRVTATANTYEEAVSNVVHNLQSEHRKYTSHTRKNAEAGRIADLTKPMIKALLKHRMVMSTKAVFSNVVATDMAAKAVAAKAVAVVSSLSQPPQSMKKDTKRAKQEPMATFEIVELLADSLRLNILLTFVIPNLDRWWVIDMQHGLYKDPGQAEKTFLPRVYYMILTGIDRFFPLAAAQVDKQWKRAMAFVLYAVMETMSTGSGTETVVYTNRLKMVTDHLGTSDPSYQRQQFQTASQRLVGIEWNEVEARLENKMNTDILVFKLQGLFARLSGLQSLTTIAFNKIFRTVEANLKRGAWNFENPAWFVAASISPQEKALLTVEPLPSLTSDEVKRIDLIKAKRKPLTPTQQRGADRIKRKVSRFGLTTQRVQELVVEMHLNISLSRGQILFLATNPLTTTTNPQQRKIYADTRISRDERNLVFLIDAKKRGLTAEETQGLPALIKIQHDLRVTDQRLQETAVELFLGIRLTDADILLLSRSLPATPLQSKVYDKAIEIGLLLIGIGDPRVQALALKRTRTAAEIQWLKKLLYASAERHGITVARVQREAVNVALNKRVTRVTDILLWRGETSAKTAQQKQFFVDLRLSDNQKKLIALAETKMGSMSKPDQALLRQAKIKAIRLGITTQRIQDRALEIVFEKQGRPEGLSDRQVMLLVVKSQQQQQQQLSLTDSEKKLYAKASYTTMMRLGLSQQRIVERMRHGPVLTIQQLVGVKEIDILLLAHTQPDTPQQLELWARYRKIRATEAIFNLAAAKTTALTNKEKQEALVLHEEAIKHGITGQTIQASALADIGIDGVFTALQIRLLAGASLPMTEMEKSVYERQVVLTPLTVENRRRLVWNLAIALVHMARGGTFGVMRVKHFEQYNADFAATGPGKGWTIKEKLFVSPFAIGHFYARFALEAKGPVYRAPTQTSSVAMFKPAWKIDDPRKPGLSDREWLTEKPGDLSDRFWLQLKRKPRAPTKTAWLLIKPEDQSNADWLRQKPLGITTDRVWSAMKAASKASMELSSLEKAVVAYLAIYLMEGRNPMFLDATSLSISDSGWDIFLANFINLP